MLINISFILSPCQWLAVWFWASPLILVCLISPTCKVGITVLSTYLPRRGVVRIHGVTFGASNLLEEVWHKHILFFIVHHMCDDLRAKEFYIQATAATVPWKSGADTTHTKAQSRLCHHSSLWCCWNWNLLLKERWKYFYKSSTATKGLQLRVFAETFFFHCLNHTGMLSFVDSRVLSYLHLIYLLGVKLKNVMGLIEVKGEIFDFCKQKLANL